jgi:general secretion pathway protein M
MMLKDWWYERNQREQYILSTGSAVVVILLVYMLIWEPLTTHVATLRQNIAQNSSLLTWMSAASNKIDQYRTQGYVEKQPNSQPILVSVEQSLMQQKLSQYISNTQQQSNEQINLTLNNVPFDKIISWLEIIWKQDNITVSTIVITKTKTVGVVNATVGLKR